MEKTLNWLIARVVARTKKNLVNWKKEGRKKNDL